MMHVYLMALLLGLYCTSIRQGPFSDIINLGEVVKIPEEYLSIHVLVCNHINEHDTKLLSWLFVLWWASNIYSKQYNIFLAYHEIPQ